MAIGRIVVGREIRHIVFQPSDQSDGFDVAYQVELEEKQRKIVSQLDQKIPTSKEIERESQLNKTQG